MDEGEAVEYLGHNIDSTGSYPTELGITKLTNYPRPTNLKQLRGFLGYTGWYRERIKGYGEISRPLVQATELANRFGNKIEWNDECEKAFQTLKIAVNSDSILIHPDPNKEFVLETDASAYGIRAFQSQEGKLRPIAFYSKHLNKAQMSY